MGDIMVHLHGAVAAEVAILLDKRPNMMEF